jgi:hypothetical protein
MNSQFNLIKLVDTKQDKGGKRNKSAAAKQ